MAVYPKVTYSQLELLNDEGKRYELHEGEVLVTAAPRPLHQRVALRLARHLEDFVEPRQLGEVYQSVDVYFSEEAVYSPDLLFISRERAHLVGEKHVQGAPDLVVEVVSPSTEARDRGIKFRAYERHGIKEYWIVDPLARKAEVYILTGGRYERFGAFSQAEALRSRLLPELLLPLAEIWR